MKGGMVLLLVVAVIVAALASMFYTVNETQVAILMYFGKPATIASMPPSPASTRADTTRAAAVAASRPM